MNRKFTILIPTKNRVEYLKYTLQSCISQDYDNLEIIVCDDWSDDETEKMVEKFSKMDHRIRYEKNKFEKGMLGNFEFAISLPAEGYVVILGGDDALVPNSISRLNDLFEKYNVEIITWPAPVYTYPGVRNGDFDGQLMIYRDCGERIINSKDYLRRQIKNLHYLSDVETPMFYVKGVVSLALINMVKSKSINGRFYNSHTPDGYSGIILANEVDNFLYSGEPYSLHGVSPSSQGLSYLRSDEKSKKLSDDFFRSVSDIKMHKKLASENYSPLITLMTADYLLRSGVLERTDFRGVDINYEDVIKKSIKELAHGLYSDERVKRELEIIESIAKHHKISNLFNEVLIKARKFNNHVPFSGNGINTKYIFFNAKDLNIGNVLDASRMVESISSLYSAFSIGKIANAFLRSLIYKIKSLKLGSKIA